MIDDEREDREATEFAMCLLMPESMVRERVTGPLTEQRVVELASEFQVPITMMTLRLVGLGLIRKGARRG